jgi:hypothetical protein
LGFGIEFYLFLNLKKRAGGLRAAEKKKWKWADAKKRIGRLAE